MSTTPNVQAPISVQPSASTTRRIIRIGAVVAAAVAATIVRLAFGAAQVIPVAPGPTGPGPVGVPVVIAAALVFGLVGWAALALCERLMPRHGFTVWVVAAVDFTLASLLIGPASATTTAGGLVLTALHVVVAAIMIIGAALSRRHH